MKIRGRKFVVIVGILIAVLLSWYFQDLFLTAGYAPFFSPHIAPPVVSEKQVMLIKNADAAGSSLLLKYGENPQFFLYNSSKRVIEVSNSSQWDESKEPELDCWDQSTPDDYTGSIYGHYLLSSKRSPDGAKIAIVSAYGPRSPEHEGMFTGGGERVFGSRYLEIRSLPRLELIGWPYRIEISSRIRKPVICWSDEGKHIVIYGQEKYADSTFSVVATPAN